MSCPCTNLAFSFAVPAVQALTRRFENAGVYCVSIGFFSMIRYFDIHLLLLLLFRHSAKNLLAQEERLNSISLHLPRVIVRLHVHKTDVVILEPETVAYPCR